MSQVGVEHLILEVVAGTVRNAVSNFLTERRARGLSPRTIGLYQDVLGRFCRWLDDVGVVKLEELTPDVIRQFLLYLEAGGHNAGGRHVYYRSIKAFLNWWEWENEGEYRNPIKWVAPPKVLAEPLPGISLENAKRMVDACVTDLADRDRSILLTLVDTGARRAELTALDVGDVDLASGEVMIRRGKGNKSRFVRMGEKCRRAVRRYLKGRKALTISSPLFATDEEDRLTFPGLRQIIRRRAVDAGVKAPGLHDFRRCCAIALYRNGVDIYTISKYLGHAGIAITTRYIRLVDADVTEAHRRGSPVDRAGW
jgi:site-specific recombinase XerD